MRMRRRNAVDLIHRYSRTDAIRDGVPMAANRR
jgi:hypothetical protein